MSSGPDDRFSDDPVRRPGAPKEPVTGFEAERRPNWDREGDEREPLPSLAREDRSLGSLAQSARLKQLNVARWVLIVIGVLIMGAHIFELTQLRSLIQKAHQEEIRKMGPGWSWRTDA
jgi:hypothetical protein